MGLKELVRKTVTALESKVFLGEVVKDYGEIGFHQVGIATMRLSVLWVRKGGKDMIAFRSTGKAALGASVSYHFAPINDQLIEKFREVTQDLESLQVADSH